MSEEVKIYTDGACLDNPGPGGWGAVLIFGPQEKKLSGSVADTTSQQMELLAACKGLSALTKPIKVTIYSDSAYLVNAFNKGWIKKWKKRNWSRKKDPLQNKFLWLWLDSLANRHEVTFKKVKAHSGIEYNELVDDLARDAAKKIADKTTKQDKKKRNKRKQVKEKNDYQGLLTTKAEEFITLLENNNFISQIINCFDYHITISLEYNKQSQGNLRIYYKPSKDRYSLSYQELKNKSLQEKIQRIWDSNFD